MDLFLLDCFGQEKNYLIAEFRKTNLDFFLFLGCGFFLFFFGGGGGGVGGGAGGVQSRVGKILFIAE